MRRFGIASLVKTQNPRSELRHEVSQLASWVLMEVKDNQLINRPLDK